MNVKIDIPHQNHSFWDAKPMLLPCKTAAFTLQNRPYHFVKSPLLQNHPHLFYFSVLPNHETTPISKNLLSNNIFYLMKSQQKVEMFSDCQVFYVIGSKLFLKKCLLFRFFCIFAKLNGKLTYFIKTAEQ